MLIQTHDLLVQRGEILASEFVVALETAEHTVLYNINPLALGVEGSLEARTGRMLE